MHPWMTITAKDLDIELAQCIDEGKDVEPLRAEFARLQQADLERDPKLRQQACRLVDKSLRLPVRKDFPFKEPSRLSAIQRARKGRTRLPSDLPSPQVLLDKAHGAWTGRCCGCLLGKPVEGRTRAEIRNYLQAQNAWPLDFYFSNEAIEQDRLDNHFPDHANPCYRENITCMVEDDDTNYTVAGLALMSLHGLEFKPQDVGDFWLQNMPIYHLCTAERVAYRNLVGLIPAPQPDGRVAGRFSCATFRNPYREWIGAMIRGDFFGYACPAEPQWAAELAWRDACISHVKNGIYGEMWVSAMLAAAYVLEDAPTVIQAGLGEIPAACRLHRDISDVLDWRRQGRTYEEAIDAIHARWREDFSHHWCHTNSNAQIVAAALLYGERDYARTICLAVMSGFDTDCNAATAGSVLGLMLGQKALPALWADPIRDTLLTGVQGYYQVRLEDLAAQTVALIEKLHR
jgi:hypothetical protein